MASLYIKQETCTLPFESQEIQIQGIHLMTASDMTGTDTKQDEWRLKEDATL